MVKHALVAFVLIGCVSACTQEEAGLVALGQGIMKGEPDTTPEHQAVVFLMTAGGAAACTGTLIAPRVVLTAGHCVSKIFGSGVQTPDKFNVSFGNTQSSAYATRTLAAQNSVIQHPNYNRGGGQSGPTNDIALLILEEDAPAQAVPIPPLPKRLGLTSTDVGVEVDFVGFGKTETGSIGTKLHVRNNLTVVCSTPGGCTVGIIPASENTICVDQSSIGGPCSGDSGGPAFLVKNGREYVVGITSYGDQNCTMVGCSTKVDAFEDFINQYVPTGYGSSCGTTADCTEGVCSDGVCCRSACDGACEACDLPASLGTCTPLPQGASCGDNDPCNGSDTCQAGQCVHVAAPSCDDGDACTTDRCESGQGCVHQAKNCADTDPCTADSCDAATGDCRHTPSTGACDDGNACTTNDSCRAGQCQGTPVDTDNDGYGPTRCGGDDCDDNRPGVNPGAFEGLTAGNCADGIDNDCDGQIDATDRGCAPCQTDADCDDGNVCNGAEKCQGTGCQSGRPLDCVDASPCTTDRCDPSRGCENTRLPDGTACNVTACGSGSCLAGECQAPAIDLCDDSNECTDDSCEATGCRNEPILDGIACGECKACSAGQCVVFPNCDKGGDSESGCGCGQSDDGGSLLLLGLFLIAIRRLR